MPRYSNNRFVHSVIDAMLSPTFPHVTLTEAVTVTDSFARSTLRIFSQSIALSDTIATAKAHFAVFIEALTIAATFTFKKNGSNVTWTHIQKSTSSAWTKAARNAATWTHINKSNQ